ncbi:MAG: hypothetical protein HFI37_06675, partial [Lachnospiraceae bacterium]|nr:hypothetical protein [Lachnospiraceae bacterium]
MENKQAQMKFRYNDLDQRYIKMNTFNTLGYSVLLITVLIYIFMQMGVGRISPTTGMLYMALIAAGILVNIYFGLKAQTSRACKFVLIFEYDLIYLLLIVHSPNAFLDFALLTTLVSTMPYLEKQFTYTVAGVNFTCFLI